MKAFWNTQDWSQEPISFVLEQLSPETGYPNDALL